MSKKYTDDQALNCIRDRKALSKKWIETKHDKWNEIYSLYRFWTDVDSETSGGAASNIFIPLAFSIVETKLPRLIQSFLSLDPWFEVEARQEQDQRAAQFMSDVMWYQMQDEVNAFYPLMMWWKEALIYGNSYMFIGWEKEEAKIRRKVPIEYAPGMVIGYDYQSKKETVYDGIALNHLDLFDCYPSPYGVRINGRMSERMPYFILRSEPDKKYLRAMAETNDETGTSILNKKAVEEVLSRHPDGYGDIDKGREERLSYNDMTRADNADEYAPKYEMYTMFEHDWWISIIGDVIVRNKENPFGDNKIPIVQAMDTPVPHEHIAIGQIEPIVKLNYYANDLENLKLDFLMKSLNPGSLISRESGLNLSTYQNDPDGIHVVNGNPQLARVTSQYPNLNFLAGSSEQANIERLIDKTLGQSDVSRGQSGSGKETATEIVSQIEQANFRFDLSTRLLKNESLVPLLDMWANRNMQFFPYEKEIRQYRQEEGQPQFSKVQIGDILGNYRYRITTNPAKGNQMAYAQTLIKFLDVLNNTQGQHPMLVKEIAKFLQIDNASEMVANPAQDAAMMIAQAAQEGLLANGQQAALVLGQVLNILAPEGSQTAKSVGGSLPQAQDNQDVARQQSAQLAGANK